MIKVNVMRTYWESGSMTYEVQAAGHAGAGEYGKDIVCAAVSVLLQTLAEKVQEATKNGTVNGSVQYAEGLMKVSATPKTMMGETLAAWFELVQAGIDMIAEQYPDNVELEVQFVSAGKAPLPDAEELLDADRMNLQLFADGGAAGGGAGAAEGEGTPAVQAPALRPAQERLAKRSRPGSAAKVAESGKAQGEETSPHQSPSVTASPEGEANQGEDEEQKNSESEEKKELSPAEKRRAFGQLMQGEYAEEFEESLQRAAQVAVQNIWNSPEVKGLMDALGEAYGVDTGDLAALTEAVKSGKVKNDDYYETLAQERGISVKTARELDRMEGELQRANAEKQRAEQMRIAAEHQQRAAAVRAQWEAEAAQLKQKYPTFDLDETLNNPAVADMIRRGVGLEAAYRAAYFDQLMENQVALTAKQVESGVTARIQQRAGRPSENGTHPGGAAEMKVDVAHMTRQQRAELARRARRGERIVL